MRGDEAELILSPMHEPTDTELAQLFAEPPLEYSDFLTYFWECGKLSKEQLTWQLEKLKEQGVGGTWYYPRYVRGEPYGVSPPYWSDGWWEIFEHYVAEHERLGMTVWFAEWTGQRGWQDRMRDEIPDNPALGGRRLAMQEAVTAPDKEAVIALPENEEVLEAAAFPILADSDNQHLEGDARRDLRDSISDGQLRWTAESGDWLVVVVTAQPHDLNYLSPGVAERWLELYFQPHVEHLERFVGGALQGYLQDELYLLNGNILWSDGLLERFSSEKGYDPRQLLAGLFFDIGDATDRIRCDYYEIMSALLEDNFYRPLSDWHDERGLLFSTIATWGRQDILGQTYHYGDYFRLCRWFHITGNEDPGRTEPGGRCFADAKMSSSILHLYERQRAAMCVYWGSGHGMTQEENLAWTNENLAYGLNMYNTHGGLYGSLGSWYEWVPPSVHFRQPYYELWKPFVDYVSRLSAVLSQGKHRADVALMYPLTSVYANWLRGDTFTATADEIATETMTLAKALFEAGIDFDFIDDRKLQEGAFRNGNLEVSGVEFRAVVLPPMTTVRIATLEKLRDFVSAGGTVFAFRDLPTGSAEAGRNDPKVSDLLHDIFGFSSSADYAHSTWLPNRHVTASSKARTHDGGGKAIFVPAHEIHRNEWHHPGYPRHSNALSYLFGEQVEQDVTCSGREVYHTHRKIGDVDAYFLYNVRSERRVLDFTFRIEGEPEIWDASNDDRKPHHRFERVPGETRVRLDMERNQGILLIFSPLTGRPAVVADNLLSVESAEPGDGNISITGLSAAGLCSARVEYEGRTFIGECRLPAAPEPVRLPDEWMVELQPTLDNRWGDWVYPASQTKLGPEARIFKYHQEQGQDGLELGWHEPTCDDGGWPELAFSFGPYWRCLGPLKSEPDDLDKLIRGEGDQVEWTELTYSQTVGHADREAYLASGGMHGVDDRFIYFPALAGATPDENPTRYLLTWVCVEEAGEWDFHFGTGKPAGAEGAQFGESTWDYDAGGSGAGQRAWVNGQLVAELTTESVAVRVFLNKGANPVALKLIHQESQSINVFAAFVEPGDTGPTALPPPPRLRWFTGKRLCTTFHRMSRGKLAGIDSRYRPAPAE